jgi:cytosine/adenosine deaminase-related metal-dependent hydrolase
VTSPAQPAAFDPAALADPDLSRPVLLQGGAVISMDDGIGDLAAGDVLISGDRIVAVGPDLRDMAPADAVVIDMYGKVVLPGMVDGHRHSWQCLFRRMTPDVDSTDAYGALYLQSLAPAYQPEDIYAANLLTALGCLDSGVTCLLDFSHNARSAGHSDAAIQGLIDSGIRGVHASMAPMYGDWDGQWPADLDRLQRTYGAAQESLVHIRMGLLGHPYGGAFTALSLERVAFARDLGLPITSDGSTGGIAAATIERLDDSGLLRPDITLVHCLDLTERAWSAIKANDIPVVLAPTSDMQIGIGSAVLPISQIRELGIRAGISVDVEVALATDLFAQMRCLLTTHRARVFELRHRGEDYPVPLSSRDVLRSATIDGARANGLADITGSLTPGKQADIIAIDASAINNMPLNNAVGTVVLGSDPRNITMVMVAGMIRKWDNQLVGVDTGKVSDLVRRSRDAVARRAGVAVDVTA